MLKVHREGRRILFGLLIFLSLVNFTIQFTSGEGITQNIIIILSLLIYLGIFLFFRNPNRYTKVNDQHIIAPADGKIVAIEQIEEREYYNETRLQISIYMSPLNIHVNRYPISGEIKYAKYHPGAYLFAWHPKSSLLNERTSVVVENPDGQSVMYKQIAGALARRIVMYAKPGIKVIQGKDSGFIKFGSRVDVILPVDANVLVKIGDKTRGGEKILAELK